MDWWVIRMKRTKEGSSQGRKEGGMDGRKDEEVTDLATGGWGGRFGVGGRAAHRQFFRLDSRWRQGGGWEDASFFPPSSLDGGRARFYTASLSLCWRLERLKRWNVKKVGA